MLVLACALTTISSVACCADSCTSYSVGVDTSLATSGSASTLREAVGQTFYATDTLISAVTIWRIPAEVNWGSGARIFILPTDSTGTPTTPALLVGPAVFNPVGDGIHPIEMTYSFDPPYVLPSRGTYEVAFLAEPCSGDIAFLARHQDPDAYPLGMLWGHSRSADSPCTPRPGPTPFPDADFVFTITFCGSTTPSPSPSWGHLKVHYR